MTPERMARLVARWVRVYTRDVAGPVAERRAEEIDADVRDQIAHERAEGLGERRIARGIASRMLRGLAADVAWRRRHAKPKTSKGLARSAVRVTLGVALILALPLVGMRFTDGVVWSLGDFLVAGVLLTTIGVVLELAVRKAGNLAAAIGVAILGVASAVFGQADDAPGLVLLGILLIVSACALGVRRAHGSG
jgi:hypothetical protein